jgi:hypothetical protein
MHDPFRLSGRAIVVPEAPVPRSKVSSLFSVASVLLLVPGVPCAAIGALAWLCFFADALEHHTDRLPAAMLLLCGFVSGIAILVRSPMASGQLMRNQPMPAIVTGIWTIMHNLLQVVISTLLLMEAKADPVGMLVSLVYPMLSIAFALWLLAIALPMRQRLRAWQLQQENRSEQVACLAHPT